MTVTIHYARPYRGRVAHAVEVEGAPSFGIVRALCGADPTAWYAPERERPTARPPDMGYPCPRCAARLATEAAARADEGE